MVVQLRRHGGRSTYTQSRMLIGCLNRGLGKIDPMEQLSPESLFAASWRRKADRELVLQCIGFLLC